MRTSSIPSKNNGSAATIADNASEKDFSKALQPLVNKILAAESLDEIIFESSKEICQIFNADRATIYTLSEDQSYLSTRQNRSVVPRSQITADTGQYRQLRRYE